MRNKYLKQLIYVVIPIITVFLCRLLKVAQGEKNEEIVFGIMLGILLDIIFFIIQKIRNRQDSNFIVKLNRATNPDLMEEIYEQ